MTEAFKKFGIGPVCVWDAQGGRGIEPLNHDAQLIVGGKIGRAGHPVKSSFVEPISSGTQEALGRSIILDALKETKETALFLVTLPVAKIVNRNDPSDHLASSFQEKEHVSE